MSAQFTIVALGDSAGVGVGARDGRGYVARTFERLARDFPDACTVNLCQSGATSGTVRDRQLSRAVAASPAVATLFVGGNDLWRGVSPREFGANLDAVAVGLANAGATVVLGTVGNMAHAPAAALAEHFAGVTREGIARRVRELNVEVARVASARRCVTVDLHTVGLADAQHYFCDDGFHPSDAGYEAWAELLWPALARAVRVSRQTRRDDDASLRAK